MRNFLPLSYFVLCLVFIGSVVSYVCASQYSIEWLKDLSLNLGTEVAGILLTVLLIDAVIRRNEAAERARIRAVALQQLRIPLLNQLQVLHGMYKAAIAQLPDDRPIDVGDLFTDSYFAQLALLDLAKPAPIASVTPLQWMDYLRMETEKFKAALARTLEKYTAFLDGSTIELLEELLASTFLSFLGQVSSVRDLDQQENYTRKYNLLAGHGMAELARKYASDFTKLVKVHNESVSLERLIQLNEGYWRSDVAPRSGSGRISGA